MASAEGKALVGRGVVKWMSVSSRGLVNLVVCRGCIWFTKKKSNTSHAFGDEGASMLSIQNYELNSYNEGTRCSWKLLVLEKRKG